MPFIPTYYTATFSNGRCVETSVIPGEHAAAPQHTPGPWNWNGTCLVSEPTRDCPDGYAVAKVFDESDARLIAAAPDLLAAAIDALETFERRFPDSPTAHDLRAAIAKATGETA